VAVTLDCQADAEVLTRDEALGLSQSVAAFNQVIEQQANDRGWGYLNPNVVLDSLKQIGEVPPFPNVPPNPLSTPEPFGPWFSRDGVHPTFAAHRLVANRLIEEINATYGTSLTPVP
ncbi:MAG: SGNH/GDSL hydrolase family protein, partial [Gemmatimonadales bacterium]